MRPRSEPNHWGRSPGNLICKMCKKDIHEGDMTLYLPPGKGVLCKPCGEQYEEQYRLLDRLIGESRAA